MLSSNNNNEEDLNNNNNSILNGSLDDGQKKIKIKCI